MADIKSEPTLQPSLPLQCMETRHLGRKCKIDKGIEAQSSDTNKNLDPPNAFFSNEQTAQMLGGACPRGLTKNCLKQWLSYRKGTSRDGSAASNDNKTELFRRFVVCHKTVLLYFQ